MSSRREVIESLYKGTCDIYEYKAVKNEETGRTAKPKPVKINTDPIRCRVSYNSSQTIQQAEGGIVVQNIKLFINPEIVINPGAKIVVTQNGRETAYKYSSVSQVYTDHQEINLEILDKWS
ncbi:hypothetical protein [Peptostreptococcus equinus]|uniref:Phage protein n=1 Tax=Peptostreptococcus equinus TaxID=3003601 RepID=A0ABY7JSK1_9FIRM|nr:hypothetical protein [Peptostreptococcus sp. CBA3647]WAW15451.1 hypothetical protein O0R46_03125 [Peptostreptococcus sp. CBA3647]